MKAVLKDNAGRYYGGSDRSDYCDYHVSDLSDAVVFTLSVERLDSTFGFKVKVEPEVDLYDSDWELVSVRVTEDG